MTTTKRPPSGKRSHFFYIVLLAILTISCNDSDKEEISLNDPMTSEVLTKEALTLSWNLLEKGQSMADAGSSIQEILKILPDSTLIQTNGNSILYFIEGSVPMVIELPGDPKAPVTKGTRRAVTSTAHTKTVSSFTIPLLLEEDEQVNVVAYEKGEEEREEKRLLIVAPFIDQFGDNDDGLVATKWLNINKNYEDRVKMMSLVDSISLTIFRQFHEYDIVHLSTHGKRFCNQATLANGSEIEIVYGGDSNYCRTLIDTNIRHTFANRQELNEALALFPVYKDVLYFGARKIYLRSSFFTHYYAQGLKDKIWIFSACELGQRNDLLDAMRAIHTNGHFFYWSNSVYPSDAYNAFDEFYEKLVKEGLDANKAFEETSTELRTGLPSAFEDPYDEQDFSIATTTSLLQLKTGEPRHGIEVIEMYHPEKEDKRVRAGDFYPLTGDFGDGEDEAITLKVEILGYTRAEFEEKQMKVSLKVDGETVFPQKPFLPDVDNDEIEVEDLEDQEYGVEVTISGIPIPDVGEKRFIKLDARLHFDDENFSIHSERVNIKPSGILATISGDGPQLILTYNEDTEAMKIAASNKVNYMDRDGWLYMKDNQTGWKKMNLSGFMGMSMAGIIGSDLVSSEFDMSDFQQVVNEGVLSDETRFKATSTTTFGETYRTGSGKANFFLPMIEWGMRFSVSQFEKDPGFKSQLVDCGKPQPCKKFIGIEGDKSGVETTFNPGGQVIRIVYRGRTITYDYGNYIVTLPTDATEFKIPFFNN
ncbi:MAG: hypothetical protein KJO04_09635 [Bacteroidia bacterium]|nr:hypothetical protein [Bacteroidia bacterium]